MKYLDWAIAWTFVVLGCLHNFVGAPQRYESLNPAALWFISGGITLWLIGALNLLRGSYGSLTPGLQKVCFLANLVATAFAVTYAAVTGAWRAPLGIVILAACAGATLLSLVGMYPLAGGPASPPQNVIPSAVEGSAFRTCKKAGSSLRSE